ncbi:hypothetical protein FS749_014281 [Ceratobasidium sp. UAMH 11750]|nr:hypothetical protein FS749_014281 [Ceratobasidium sp. UAMH 11750]
MVHQGKELAPYLEALQNWRWETFVHHSEDLDTPIQQIMTDTELKNITHTRGLQDIGAFDAPETCWPARESWRQEVLDLLMNIQTTEDDRNTEALATRTAKKGWANTSRPQRDVPRTPQAAKKDVASQVSKTEANDAKIQDDMIREVGGSIGECILTWRTSPIAATPDTQGTMFDWQAQVTPVGTPSRPPFKQSQPLQSVSPAAVNTEATPQKATHTRSSLALMEDHLLQYKHDIHNTQPNLCTADNQTLLLDLPNPTPTSHRLRIRPKMVAPRPEAEAGPSHWLGALDLE